MIVSDSYFFITRHHWVVVGQWWVWVTRSGETQWRDHQRQQSWRRVSCCSCFRCCRCCCCRRNSTWSAVEQDVVEGGKQIKLHDSVVWLTCGTFGHPEFVSNRQTDAVSHTQTHNLEASICIIQSDYVDLTVFTNESLNNHLKAQKDRKIFPFELVC